MSNNLRVHLVRQVAAPAKTVFEAWLDPKRLAEFLKPAPGTQVVETQVDAKVGGKFQLVFLIGDSRIPIHGEYRSLDRYRELAFSWLADHNLPTSLVTLTFEETAPRSTRMTLLHTGFPDEIERGKHDSGWTRIVDGLVALFAA